MKRLNVLALDRLKWDKAHLRPRHCFTDCFGVATVILIAFDLRLHKLEADQLEGMAELLKFPRLILGTAARFHPYEARRELCNRCC